MNNGARSSSPEEPRKSWVRWLTPSIGDVVFVALLSVLLFTPLSVRLLGDGGIGWHIRTGQQVLATHAIPRVDLFSAPMHGKPWFAWEWLYDVVVGGFEKIAGLNGVVFFTAVVIAAVFAWTFRLMVRRATNVAVAVALVLLAASASMIHFFARPHVVSWLFTLAWFAILDATEQRCLAEERPRSARALWSLPLLMLVWVNIHGGWLVGFVLLGIYWIGAAGTYLAAAQGTFENLLSRIRLLRRAKQLVLVGIVSALATLANPYGWRLHSHIYHYLTDRFLMDHIDEFQSPNFHGVAQRCFAVLILLAFVAFAAKRHPARWSERLVALFAVYSGLVASRNIPVASLLLALVVGPLLSDALSNLGKQRFLAGTAAPRSGVQLGTGHSAFFGRMATIELSLRGHVWPILAVIVSSWVVFHGGFAGSARLMDAHFDSMRFPVKAVGFIATHDSYQPILSPDYWGGYLIYRLYPGALVVADDRHDLYGDEFFKSYLKMVHVEPGWEDLIHEHQVGRILMPKGSALANILAESPDWTMTYEDDVAVLFDAR